MKKLFPFIFALVISLSLFSGADVKADNIMTVKKAYYVNKGKDLTIETNIKNPGKGYFGGIYKVKIIILDKKNNIIVNNVFTDAKLQKQVLRPNQNITWKFLVSNAKKGDLSKINYQAYVSWSGAQLPQNNSNSKSTIKPSLKISRVYYTTEDNKNKLVIQGVFNSIDRKYTNINNVNIKIYDKKNVLIASAAFNDTNLKNAAVNINTPLNWTFKILNPKSGDISAFRYISSFNYK